MSQCESEVLHELASYAVTCLVCNQPEWMEGLAERINRAAEVMGDRDRFEFDGRMAIRPVRPQPAPESESKATDGTN